METKHDISVEHSGCKPESNRQFYTNQSFQISIATAEESCLLGIPVSQQHVERWRNSSSVSNKTWDVEATYAAPLFQGMITGSRPSPPIHVHKPVAPVQRIIRVPQKLVKKQFLTMLIFQTCSSYLEFENEFPVLDAFFSVSLQAVSKAVESNSLNKANS